MGGRVRWVGGWTGGWVRWVGGSGGGGGVVRDPKLSFSRQLSHRVCG